MEYTTCKDSIMELIDDGSKVFGNDYKISKEMLSKINEVCDGVDELVSEIECLSFTEEELTGSSTSLQN